MASSYAFLDSFQLSSAPEDVQNLVITTLNEWISTEFDHTSMTTTSKQYYGHDQSVTDHSYVKQHADKLEEFKNLLISNSLSNHDSHKRSLAALNLVDAVLRLGVEYHFQEEIEAILQREYLIFSADHDGEDCNTDRDPLYEVALRFRLLRQGGYHVSADVFNKFKDTEGRFNPTTLAEDKEGLMQLFEASQLSTEEELVLEEAEDFSRYHLGAWLNRLEPNRARTMIQNTLEQPYHKSLVRLTARNVLPSLQGAEEHWMTVLEQVAKTDFGIVQSVHKKEIVKITRWWEEIGLAKKLKFARDQPLKWYLWTVATLADPRLSNQRIELTKPISLVYIIDDIFDVYGKLEELDLFTNAVNKWEITAAEKLPDYMKICFEALNDITNEIAYKVYKTNGWNPIDSLKKAWAKLCNAFLLEAQWFASKELPNEEDYLKNAIVSSGVHVVLVHMFFLLGQGITMETVNLLDQIPGLVSSTATILRLWDDLGNAKDENQSGHDGSYIECYIKGHQGCLVEVARDRVIHMIKKEWKRLNQECLTSKAFPMCFRRACLDAARMVPVMYDYDDDHRLPGLEDYIKSLLS
nr:terpene synthase [Ficus pandurata]